MWVRIIFDTEQQREAFIASTEHMMGDDDGGDEIGVIEGEESND